MKKLWGGRFKEKLNKDVLMFTSSIQVDKILAEYDIQASCAHLKMLYQAKIISKKESDILFKGLKTIEASLKQGRFKPSPEAEDIHTDIQNKLEKIVGEVADKLHTARSRNDLVSVDMRLYSKNALNKMDTVIKQLQKALLKFSRDNIKVIIPGLTHLQPAQPILLSHQLLAYVEMLERDRERLKDAYKRVDVLPLGSAALAGTSLPMNRALLARELGFSHIAANSIDAVSDRDFVLEILSDLAIMATHLSRLAEDIILMSSGAFAYFDLDETIATGSSIMPQKKNPDVLELIRGQAGRSFGDLISTLVMMKGLPLSYNRDMQLDKEPLFNAFTLFTNALKMMKKVFLHLKVNRKNIAKSLEDEFIFATDLAEYLVKKGVAFRKAHNIVGEIVKECLEKDKKISDLTLREFKKFSSKFEKNVYKYLDAEISVKEKRSSGGTSPANVKRQIKQWEGKLNA